VVWIRCRFSNCKDISEYMQSKSFSWTNFKTFDFCAFSILYTTILHSKVKYRLKQLSRLCFSNSVLKVTTLTFTLKSTTAEDYKQTSTTYAILMRVQWFFGQSSASDATQTIRSHHGLVDRNEISHGFYWGLCSSFILLLCLVFFPSVSCLPNVPNVSGLSIFDCHFGSSYLYFI
jgi:hypothetical protein